MSLNLSEIYFAYSMQNSTSNNLYVFIIFGYCNVSFGIRFIHIIKKLIFSFNLFNSFFLLSDY